MDFNFKLNTNAYFGHGITRTLPDKLEEFGFCKPGIVIDENVYETSAARKLIDSLSNSQTSIQYLLKAQTDREPDYDYLDICAGEFKKYDFDCLIGIGGGSAMDLCKGIAILLTNPGKGIEYRGMNRVKNPSLPAVLIPTTAGTGSEASFSAVFIDRENKIKLGINGRHVSAFAAFIDSDFTAFCPHDVAVGAGLDAMVHALEAFMTVQSNPIVWLTAIKSWSMLFNSFEKAVNGKENSQARLEMLIGSYLAGITLMYTGGGVAGSLSYPLGTEYNVPHGLAGGVILPYVIEMNIKNGYEGYSVLYDEIERSDYHLDPALKCKKLHEKFLSLLSSIEAPFDLKQFGIPEKDIEPLSKACIEQRNAVLKLNPVPVDEIMLRNLLSKVI